MVQYGSRSTRFYIPHILIPCQSLEFLFPTVQTHHLQVGSKVWCVACSALYSLKWLAIRSGHQRYCEATSSSRNGTLSFSIFHFHHFQPPCCVANRSESLFYLLSHKQSVSCFHFQEYFFSLNLQKKVLYLWYMYRYLNTHLVTFGGFAYLKPSCDIKWCRWSDITWDTVWFCSAPSGAIHSLRRAYDKKPFLR